MVKFITTLLVLLTYNISMYACDACGCSLNGNGFGVLSKYNTSIFSMGWQHGAFESNNFSGNSRDYFNTFEVSARLNLPLSFKLSLSQGFKYNERYKAESLQNIDGLSDAKILLSYPLYQNQWGASTSLYAELGGGVKLPNGKYSPNILDQNLPENFNAGTGNWGLLIQPIVILKYKKLGLISQYNYDNYGKSRKSNYSFGNRSMWSTSVFYEFQLSKRSNLIGSYGILNDRTQVDTYNNGNNVHGTGNKILHSNFSILYKIDKVAFGLNYFLPMSQELASGEVKENHRFSTNISYLF